MTTPRSPKNTAAFYAQAAISFGVALFGIVIGELYLPVDGWVRAFLALATLYLVTATFTLAKCVRDAQEDGNVISRLDQVRLERLLAEFDPYHSQTPHLAPPPYPWPSRTTWPDIREPPGIQNVHRVQAN
jgi:hypothetical protein